jgi:hypothetical protein
VLIRVHPWLPSLLLGQVQRTWLDPANGGRIMPTDTPSANPPPGRAAALDTAALETLVGRVIDEFTERLQRGESPDPEEYVRLLSVAQKKHWVRLRGTGL